MIALRQSLWKRGGDIVSSVCRPPAACCVGCLGRPSWSRPPRRVFLSHTSSQRAFVAAAQAAVLRAGDALIDMDFFTAQRTDPAQYCAEMVAVADVYVGIIGMGRGSPTTGRPDITFTEFEFETATEHRLPRLMFLLEEAKGRETAFHRRLRNANLTAAVVASPAELELRLYQALVELPACP